MCRSIGLQLLRGGDTDITSIFIVKRIQCCAVPSPKQKKNSFDVMLSELVFSFMLKFEDKKKRETAGVLFLFCFGVVLGFVLGGGRGVSPLGQESVSVRGNVA